MTDGNRKPQSDPRATSQPQDIYQLSNLPKNQLWFWIGQNLEPEMPLFNMPMAITLHGEIDHERFSRSFQQVVNRSDALRTVVDTVDGIPQRRVLPSSDYEVMLLDLSDESDPEQVFGSWANERCRRIFDMSACMFDAVLVKIENERYIWYWCQHHLICDGWSTALVYRYVSESYAESTASDADSSSSLPAFEDYAQREREYRYSDEHEASRIFWESELAEPLDTLSMYGKTAHEHGTTQFLRVTRDLGEERTTGLKRLAAEKPFAGLSQHFSVFQLTTTCLLAYLYRLTGHDRLAIGTLYHNRQTSRDKNTIGYFMEMAPMRVDVSGDDSFGDLFKKVRNASLDVMRHYRFAPGSPINNRSYDVALNYNNASYPSFAGIPISIHWLHTGAWYSHEPLAIQIHDFGDTGTFTAAFDFNCGMFDEDNRERIVTHFFNCIDALISDPAQLIGDFPILTDDEQSKIFDEYSLRESKQLAELSLHDLFSEQAARSPQKTAVYSDDCSYSYAELDQRSNQLAAHLVKQGVSLGDRVGISMRRHPDFVVSMLGILKAGAAYVPLDPDYPDVRLSFMLRDSGVKILLTHADMAKQLPAGDASVLCLDRDWDDIGANASLALGLRIDPDGPAYVIYTSGSTGNPKGVLVEHRAIVNYTQAAIDAYGVSNKDTTLQFASISFDTAGEEIYTTITTGGTLYLAGDPMFASARDFLEVCSREKLTFLDLPTAFWHQITTTMIEEDLQLPSSVRLLIIGGERALPQFVCDWLKHDHSGCRLVNTYGPTESTIVAVWCDLNAENSAPDRDVPIGRPVRNARVYVLDKRLQAVPIGAIGELHIGGPGLARGYLNQPQLTNEKFITDPFSPEQGSRLYKTGDLVRFRRDGLLEYKDRADDQTKVRGYRIELGEVESVLLKCDMIENGAVLVKEAQPGDKRLVAYFVVASGQSATSTDLRTAMRLQLPDYMIPQHFVEIDALPMSVNGKVDRKRLPNPFTESGLSGDDIVAPESVEEKEIAEVWRGVLQIENISRHDNFFDIGGHSLLMMQLIANMENKMQFVATPRMIVMQSLAQLASEYAEQKSADTKPGPAAENHRSPLFVRARRALKSLVSR